jgi:hypothetical protein
MCDEWSDRQERLQIEGYKKLHTAVRCPKCRTMNRIMRKDGSMCKHCGDKQEKVIKRVLSGVALMLAVLLCGCQSAPSKASVEIKVAGQSVVMNFKK